MTNMVDQWIENPCKSFEELVASAEFVKLGSKPRPGRNNSVEPLSAAAASIYKLMFSAFIRFLHERKRTLLTASESDIIAFLSKGKSISDEYVPDLQSAIARRYLRLIERVYQHLGLMPNPARSVYLNKSDTLATDGEMVVLTTAQRTAVLANLPQCVTVPRKANPFHGWKRVRDRAMIAMMLGAGVTVSEVIALPLSAIGEKLESGTREVTVLIGSGDEFSDQHNTVLHAFAVPEISAWLDLRKNMAIPGTLMFPASINGDKKLASVTVYRQVRATFERAGVNVDRRGGRTLRNTYAVMEIAAGTSLNTLKARLGLQERRSTGRYRAVFKSTVNAET